MLCCVLKSEANSPTLSGNNFATWMAGLQQFYLKLKSEQGKVAQDDEGR